MDVIAGFCFVALALYLGFGRMSDVLEEFKDQYERYVDAMIAAARPMAEYTSCDVDEPEGRQPMPVKAQEIEWPLNDLQLWENSCITRAQIKCWTDEDIAKHAAGMRHTVQFLLAKLDALAAQADASGDRCAKIAERLAAHERTISTAAETDGALSETGRQRVQDCSRARETAAEEIARQIRAAALSDGKCGEVK